MRSLKTIKHRLYYYFAEKNWGVRREYGPYVDAHQEDHHSHRWKHWWLLIRLNWHYRILRSKKFLIREMDPALRKKTGAPAVPYMPKPESRKRNWTNAYRLAQSLLNYDLISFDIFDTLLLRKLNNPTDVFSVVGSKLNCIDFYAVRRLAEQESRGIKLEKEGTREVTIQDIYERVAYYTGIDAEQGAALELETECDICFANPYLYRVYSILKTMGKTVVATSDMYLPKEQMKKLLDSCGYEQIDEIFVSCDYQCDKVEGGLFDVLRHQYGEEKKIVHIGDNFKGDVVPAREHGLDARHYVACRNLGNPHRCAGMSPLVESSYRALVNNTLHNGLKSHSYAWEFGFVYGGLPTLGYIGWIHEQAVRQGVTKLLFVARDGFVLKKAYDLLFHDIPSEYVYWSRSAALRCVGKEERYYFLDHFLQRRNNKGETLRSALQVCGIEEAAEIFIAQGVSVDSEITDENMEQLRDIAVAHWPEIAGCFQGKKSAAKQYLSRVIQGHSRVAVVDMGFSGKNTKVLQDVLTELGLEREYVKLYLLGNVLLKENADMMLSGAMESYLFDAQDYLGVRNQIVRYGEYGCSVFEKMYGAPHPSLLEYQEDGTMIFAPMESENNEKLVELQNGILEFCRRYTKAFEKHPEFCRISPQDAFAPFQMLLRSRGYVYRVIGDLRHAVRVSMDDATAIASKN